MYYYY